MPNKESTLTFRAFAIATTVCKLGMSVAYVCVMSQRDIAEQVKELYDVEISPEFVTKITEKIKPEVTA